MKNLQNYVFLLLSFLVGISLMSCQIGKTSNSTQIEEVSQITGTGSEPTPTQQIAASEEVDSTSIPGKRMELQDSDRWIRMLALDRHGLKYGGPTLSPDGEWIVTNAMQEPKEFQFFDLLPTADENLMFTFLPAQALGRIVDPIWSPNGTNLAYRGADRPRSLCYYSRLVILQIDPVNLTATPAAFELPSGEQACADFTWSPDGSKLAIILDSHVGEIYILGVTGQVLDKILIPDVGNTRDQSNILADLAWTSTGFFYSIKKELRGLNINELYQLDLSTNESLNIFRLGDWWLLGLNPTYPSKFLLTRNLSQYDDPTLPYNHVSEYAILDIVTQEIFKLELENSTCHVFPSTSIFTVFACNDPHELWIYNWQDESLNNYGEYRRVLGWSDKHQGYLLLEGSEENPRIEALQP